MKHIRYATISALAAFSMTPAMASGSHPGGHAQDEPSAIGLPGDAAKVTRTIQVDMGDNMRFSPERIEVRKGETIRFVVKNSGKVRHELVLGTEADLQAHYEAMLKNPEMEHADPNQLTLAPGMSGEIVWQFNRDGVVPFGCLQPGHYSAGMKGVVRVASGKKEALR